MLSDNVKELIKKSRIVSFASWSDKYPEEAIAIWQEADDQGKYLSDEAIEQLIAIDPKLKPSLEQAKLLRDNVNDIVAQARGQVLATYPQITEPGGDLYPPTRAEACWRDFWHFLRCITYGISGQSIEYTSEEGLGYMKQLYQELQVPLNAMIVGLENLKSYSLQQFSMEQQVSLSPYFDHLIDAMKQFDVDRGFGSTSISTIDSPFNGGNPNNALSSNQGVDS